MTNEYPNIFALEKINEYLDNEYICEYIVISEYSSHTGNKAVCRTAPATPGLLIR